MDYYRTSTKILDSWDLINFPVKQPNLDLHRERSIDDNSRYSNVCVLKGARKKLARRKEPFRNRNKVESSTSLILKKTDRQVFNDYSVLSFTNILQSHNPVYGDFGAEDPAANDKPLIKVTVFPKTDPQTGSTKTKDNVKKNWNRKKPENSFNNKNVYLVVAGRKKEKVYQVNTTAAKHSECSLQKNDSSTTECANIKELLKINLNKCKTSITHLQKESTKYADDLLEYGTRYDCECTETYFRRKEEGKLNKMSKNKANSTQKTKKNTKVPEEFRLTFPIKESNKSNREGQKISPRTSVNGQKSRIRITGRLGLTEDDRYVLKCNATLDDEPIPTFPTNEDLMPMALCADEDTNRSPVIKCLRSPRNQRDSNIQADVRYFKSPSYGQTSQATQVNLEILYPQKHNTKIIANTDKIIQCYCANTPENATYVSDEREDIALKECTSPIVIISVYPQQESSDKVTNYRGNLAEDVTKSSPHADIINERKSRKVTNNEEAKNITKTVRSRSPSPIRSAVKEKNSKEVKPWATATNSKKQLREGTVYTFRSTKIKSSKVQTTSQVNPATSKKTERQKSSVSPRCSSPNSRAGCAKTKQKNTTGTNTEKTLAKKALVDSFTKQYTARMIERNIKDGSALKSKQDVSNVTVNIEGDNDYYNVMFRQRAFDTDLTVRKTAKGNVANYPRDNDSNSLENFLFIEPDTDRRQTSFSQTFMPDTDTQPPHMTTSKLNVRDSIQLSHWREDKHCNAGKTTQSGNRNEVDIKFLAPIKHFQGDECSISDPNERDKEIRGLLGIDRGRFKPPAQNSSEASAIFGQRKEVSLTCLCRDHSVRVYQSKNKDLIGSSGHETPLNHQLILNRNIQVLLQINRLNKHCPIVLSRRQYAKVKRTIYSTLLKKNSLDKQLRNGFKNSSVSIGSVKVKPKVNVTFHYNKETQTGPLDMATTIKHNDPLGFIKCDSEYIKETINNGDDVLFTCQLSNHGEAKESTSSIHKSLDRRRNLFSNQFGMSTNNHSLSIEQREMTLLCNASFSSSQKMFKKESDNTYSRKAASSLEIQYATEVSYSKRVKFSSSDLAQSKTPDSIKRSISQNLDQKESHSIHTIFKGHRRCHTPNLGTSAYSLCTESVSEHSHALFKCLDGPVNYELKPKKPFLRRLISCLVMRASRTSAVKFPVGPTRKDPSMHSSIDSYHINTSLGGMDMSSSLYDTSVSFFSNHTIKPISKMKRGFFSSVRGFLNSRRS